MLLSKTSSNCRIEVCDKPTHINDSHYGVSRSWSTESVLAVVFVADNLVPMFLSHGIGLLNVDIHISSKTRQVEVVDQTVY